ncbi:MAG: tyrosine-type recombinase/integrase [Alphaproteobacteria bacterium]|nr:tyrosine-type recombinase/integrase [Alphaproteobacteria bacterium]
MANRRLPLALQRLRDWTAHDQQAWKTACRDGGLFDETGPLAKYPPGRLRILEAAYSRWYTYLEWSGASDLSRSACAFLDVRQLKSFVSFLDGYIAPCSVATYLADLLIVARALAPERNFQDLERIAEYFRRHGRPVREKRLRVVPIRDLFHLGFKLMEGAGSVDGPLRKVLAYRDRLMIAMLAACPLRRNNFAATKIDNHLILTEAAFRLAFAKEEVKNRFPLDYPLPTSLSGPIDRYLAEHRPLLLARRRDASTGTSDKAFWISQTGTPLRPISFWIRTTALTRKHLGQAINPHLFRDCAATSIAIELPAQVGIIRPVLGHTNGFTGQRYYNQARTLEAARAFQGAVDTLIKGEVG